MHYRILIIKPGAMGDLLHLTPTIRGLRKLYPRAKIDVLVGNTASIDLFRHHPDVADVLVYDQHSEHRSFSVLRTLWREIRSRSYDLVINFQRSNLRTWFLTSAALPCRVLVYHKTRTGTVHAVRDHLKTVASLGISPDGDELDLYLAPEDRQYASALFKSHGLDKRSVVAFNPGASHPVNRWSTAQFAVLADRVSSELNAAVIIIGGHGDTPLANEINQLASTRPLVLTGTTSLLQLGAVLEKTALLVSGDTGPMHMATAVRTPVIALFGAADPARTGPTGSGNRVLQAMDVACVPCRSRKCGTTRNLECMERISVDDVFEAVRKMLDQRKKCVS